MSELMRIYFNASVCNNPFEISLYSANYIVIIFYSNFKSQIINYQLAK